MRKETKKFESVNELERMVKVGEPLLILTNEVVNTLLSVFDEGYDSLDKCGELIMEIDFYGDDLNEENYTIFKNKLLAAIQECFTDEEILELTKGAKVGEELFEYKSEKQKQVMERLKDFFIKLHKQEHKDKVKHDKAVERAVSYRYAFETIVNEFCEGYGFNPCV